MATKTSALAPQHKTKTSDVDLAQRRARADSWVNPARGMGGPKDRRATTTPSYEIVEWPKEQLDAFYASDDVAKRVVDLFPEEMTREGYKIPEDVTGELFDVLSSLKVNLRIEQALRRARHYGGAAILVGADDGQPLSKPLKPERIKRIRYLHVLDRFDMDVYRYYKTLDSGKFGEPELYRINSANHLRGEPIDKESGIGYGAKIHESRLIRFDGTTTPFDVMQENEGWALSVLQAWYEPIRDFQASAAGISNLIPEFGQAVIKIKDLVAQLSTPNADMILTRLAEIDGVRSISNFLALDADEDFAKPATPVSGLADLYDRVAQKLSMAVGAPITLLTGISPAGMNATGESDHRFFYNKVGALQQRELKEPVEALINMIANVYNVSPAGTATRYSIEFNPLWRLSESEQAQIRESNSRTDKNYIEAGVLTRDEVAVSRFANGYSADTVLGADTKSGIVRAGVDVTAVTALVAQVCAGQVTPQAAKNLLLVLHKMPEAEVVRLLRGVVPKPPEPAKPQA